MEIRDVIGSLRLADLELARKVDELRLAVHLLEYRFDALDGVSRETDIREWRVSDATATPDEDTLF